MSCQLDPVACRSARPLRRVTVHRLPRPVPQAGSAMTSAPASQTGKPCSAASSAPSSARRSPRQRPAVASEQMREASSATRQGVRMPQASAPDQRLLARLPSLFGIAEDQEGQCQVGERSGAHVERGVEGSSGDAQDVGSALARRTPEPNGTRQGDTDKEPGSGCRQVRCRIAQLLAEAKQIQGGFAHRCEIAARLVVSARPLRPVPGASCRRAARRAPRASIGLAR